MIDSENGFITATSKKERIVSFLWQHLLLICSLFIMTLGVAVCVRSNFGSSVISSIPLAMTLAGTEGKAPGLTIGDYTNIMKFPQQIPPVTGSRESDR